MRKSDIPPLDWWKAENQKRTSRWDATPWHAGGDIALKPLTQEIRRLGRILGEMPGNFLSMTADQHLALLSEGYRYESFVVIEDFGDDRLSCLSVDGEEFALYSPGTRKDLASGAKLFFTALVPFGSHDSDIECFTTYGPILTWISLTLDDMEFLARRLARDLYASQGFSAVARRNPVSFWASGRWGSVPKLMHGQEALRTCQALGRLSTDFLTRLDAGWERDDAGAKTRYIKRGEKPFFDRSIYHDRKTDKALLSAAMEAEFEALLETLGDAFTPDPRGEDRVSPLMEMIWKELSGKTLEYQTWERPFLPKKRETDLNDNAAFSRIEKAIPDIIEAVNTRKEPDWIRIGERHALSAEDMENLKELAQNLREKLK